MFCTVKPIHSLMPSATPLAVRQLVIDLFTAEVSKSEIARRLELSRSTVIAIIRRYEVNGESGLEPTYYNCGPSGPRTDAFLVRAYCCLKRWHSGWGYDRISSLIISKYNSMMLPDRRTVYRWWNTRGLVKSKAKGPPVDHPWAKTLHEGWQVDAKEKMTTADGERCCWFNIVDEASGTVVAPPVFPPQEYR